jgi:hypothetical protein
MAAQVESAADKTARVKAEFEARKAQYEAEQAARAQQGA